MSDTTDVTSDVSHVADGAAPSTTRRRRTGSGLAAMLLPELQSLAASLGITGTGRMRKGELISAIQERQGGVATAPRARGEVAAREQGTREEVRADVLQSAERVDVDRRDGSGSTGVAGGGPAADAAVATVTAPPAVEPAGGPDDRAPRRANRPAGPPETGQTRTEVRPEGRTEAEDRPERVERTDRAERTGRGERPDRAERGDRGERNADRNGRGDNGRDRSGRAQRADRDERDGRAEGRDRGDNRDRDIRDSDDEDADGGGRRGRRSRFRDRRRGRGGDRGEGGEPQVTEDDVLVPVAGIIDVLDNYAFVRTTGYLSGPNDVYVSMAQVKKNGLRRGDAVTGAVRAPREGEQRRDKYNPLVRLDSVNGMDPEEARRRQEFYKLTPLYPQDRLRLETEPHILTTRVIDLVMPIGKGQRALIVSPPKAGKTMVLQAIANAITRNNPECHLMVVLVDERPEEVTDMQRSVKGEVIASTFDRPPQDHTTVAELAIERAKRLVELGNDVVVLLDSITRLGRAYNLAAPASGRILSGGIDSTALYPPKRFLGAARNIENGGSLTILATALVETGSMMDTVIFEEFKGTGNAELKLDRKIADKRVFPAIDIDPSGTRKEEILLAPEELAIVHKLRKVLHSLESQAALDLLLSRLKETRTNVEFLMQIAKTTPGE